MNNAKIITIAVDIGIKCSAVYIKHYDGSSQCNLIEKNMEIYIDFPVTILFIVDKIIHYMYIDKENKTFECDTDEINFSFNCIENNKYELSCTKMKIKR